MAGGPDPSTPRLPGRGAALAPPAPVHGLKLPSFDSNFNLEPGPLRGPRKISTMHARRFAVPLLALAFGFSFSAFVGAVPDAPAANAPEATQEVAKACCKHHEAAAEKTGMHCDHARMKAEGEKGEACCAQHAKMHQEGTSADGKTACAHHAAMKKDAATADGKACCAQHAAMHKDGDKAGCCCCGAGEACPHHATEEAPAKS